MIVCDYLVFVLALGSSSATVHCSSLSRKIFSLARQMGRGRGLRCFSSGSSMPRLQSRVPKGIFFSKTLSRHAETLCRSAAALSTYAKS